jgi:hypothetical protein
MKSRSEIMEKREQAYSEAGWGEGGVREWPNIDDAAEESARLRDRSFAEGVEAALLWVLGDAGDPFPR